MGHRINGAELSRQLALRGTEKQEFAEAAEVSPATISHAISGRPISTRTLRAIATALSQTEPLAGVEALLARDGQPGHESAASSTPELTASTEDGHRPPTAPR